MRLFLRLEHAVLFLTLGLPALMLFATSDLSWWWLPVLFLAPDLSFVAYTAGPKIGAVVYNAVHTWIAPATLFLLGWLGLLPFDGLVFALIWASHIAFDRMLGYGLKHESGFQDTHLGRIGRE